MALLNCPECSKEVSDRASTCPSCGYPLRSLPFDPEYRAHRKIALIAALILSCVAIPFGIMSGNHRATVLGSAGVILAGSGLLFLKHGK